MPENLISFSFNILIIGETCGGKTSIVEKYFSRHFSNRAHSSVYDDYTCLKLNNTKMGLRIHDAPGQDRFKPLILKSYCKTQDLLVFVYKINNRSRIHDGSFEYAQNLIKEAKGYYNEKMHYALIGSCADRENEREISKEEGEELARNEGMDFFMEVSAYNGTNIDNMFFEIAIIK